MAKNNFSAMLKNMREIIFDIETKQSFAETKNGLPEELDVSMVGIFDSSNQKLMAFREEQLKDLWPIFERADVIVGYNINHFDLPVLTKYYHGNMKLLPSFDLFEAVKNILGIRLKLDTLAKANLGTQKLANGLQAIEYFRRGDFASLEKYCLKDVEITRDIYEVAKTQKKLKYHDLRGNLQEFDIDLSPHLSKFTKQNGASQRTLPF